MLTSLLRSARDLACMITIAAVADIALAGGEMTGALIAVIVAELGGIPILAMDAYCCESYRVESERIMTLGLAERIKGAQIAWLDEKQVGDLISTATADVEKVTQWQFSVLPNVVRTLAYLAGGLWYCLTQSAAMTACVFPVAFLAVPLINRVSAPLKKNSDIQRREAANSLSQMQEILTDPELVKGYHLEEEMDRRLAVSLRGRRAAEEKAAGMLAQTKMFGKLGSYVPMLFTAVLGVFFYLRGQITVGFLFSFVQMVSSRFGYVIPQISDMIAQSYQTGASAQRILEILDAPQEEAGKPSGTAREETDSDGIYELRHVSFSYPGAPDRPVLQDVSLTIRRGERIALVGASGCGKSTLLKLLLGIYQPTQGELYYRGQRMTAQECARLRDEAAPVFQSPFLFPLRIRDNLHVFERPCTEEEMRAALKAAGLYEMICAQADGLDTVLTQHGSSLSGGQQQRMSIARAYLKDAPVLMFDEPTSAMDTVTQAAFEEAFERISRGKTSVTVSHRWPVIEKADRIYVLAQGRIVQSGTHAQLLQEDGAYKRLYAMQAEG